MSSQLTFSGEVQTLKDAADALFKQRKFTIAFEKYTEAIKLAPEDAACAVLYNNRSACSMSMNQYSDAISDAHKATVLDPNYTRAWTRKASALYEFGSLNDSLKAWKRAKASLPTEDLTEDQLKQLAKCDENIQTTTRFLDANSVIKGISVTPNDQPWDRAKCIVEEMIRSGKININSSAWSIAEAARDFKEGAACMKQLRITPGPNGTQMTYGNLEALQNISNGVMMDRRVFHTDTPDWIIKLEEQIAFTVHNHKAWTSGSAEEIVKNAQRRLLATKWEDVRPALATTVRTLIMNGIILDLLPTDHSPAVNWFGEAMQIIQRGRVIWHDVPKEERGIIFEDSFLNGVRKIHLNATLHAYAKTSSKTSRKQKANPLKALFDLADELFEDISRGKRDGKFATLPPAYTMAFVVHPMVEAQVSKAFYHKEMANLSESQDERMDHMFKASLRYLAGAKMLPQDDELHTYYIAMSLQYAWSAFAPLRDTLPLLALLRDAIPRTKIIWENSAAQQEYSKLFDPMLSFEDEMREGLRTGKYSEESVVQGPH